ncbi:penicillin-binding protein 2 [Candidatus Beckwithbacteria bacterium]|nr:penicillin-binding protein 2 [Candidatus Beckwithbacteria bacterium]
MKENKKGLIFKQRSSFILIVFLLIAILIIARLFYWQVLNASSLSALASSQRQSISEILPNRGSILASDGFPLAINQEGFLLYANPQEVNIPAESAASMLTPILVPSLDEVPVATDASQKEIEELKENLETNTHNYLVSQLNQKNLVWVLLQRKLPLAKKTLIEKLNIAGLYFQNEPVRDYPEGSMSAQILGFIGQDEQGRDKGYFGLEGFYDLDLSGRIGIVKQEKDALNRPIPIGKFWDQKKRDGRHLQLYLDRSIQFLVEEALKEAVKKYGAKSGSVIVMDPKTGGILAMASWPSFNPNFYTKYNSEDYVNPVVSLTYEPGSTFKTLVMSAAINEGVITPDTICDMCDRPYKIDKYYIRTWNNQYFKNSTMIDVLVHSDNVGMVFVSKKLGMEKFVSYLKNFGIGEMTGIDLQGEIAPPLRETWSEIDLSTASFGQGLVVTPMQMIKVVGAIANEGKMMQPRMVEKIIDNDKEIELEPKFLGQVISKETAETVKEMMVASALHGDAKWTALKNYRIAGKTGTAQVAVEGHYDEDKTIASFVGFAPADNPAFVMLTIIQEPSSSPWGSETAAPLFFNIAKKLFIHLGISPKED